MNKPAFKHVSKIMPKKVKRLVMFLGLLLIISVILSLCLGARFVNFHELMDGLFYHQSDSYGANIVQKRLSRTVFSLLCGAALGVAGSLMQAVTRNPLADPSILGVNMGASLFVVCGIAFFQISTASAYIWLALLGAGLTAVLVFGIGAAGRGGVTPLKLVLSGAAISAALSSLVVAVMLPNSYAMDQFRFWQVGSVGSATWNGITAFLPFLIIGFGIALLTAPALNALALGDDVASGLGVKPGVLRLSAASGGVILCAAATALAGPIGFIGLLATHVTRLLVGPDLRLLIPISALSGAIILTLADIIGRVIASPGEINVGIVTAFIGAPILIVLAKRLRVRSL
ncbi:Probable siderophore transport system permease protein yfiZ precursor [Listeria grayi]|uniref:Iron chelate uptake ABC transporter, FeCT family, permease protein n=3 Tax=Listeria grayi TaxID=1641 RepID=D7UWV0_LISGR|nr:iron ABC transporter permease [Listeria grayi]EFI84158.1 iron chelate uptake ABC transporter, FeCT family, permease protein [Listeria grayi DSM 20601]EUJ26375.1 transport system permease [Listeria grayi FSL F6-1183]VEI31727.1 Probable siderophore transport system permease protein yfiZ precursor [Listeria grayi]